MLLALCTPFLCFVERALAHFTNIGLSCIIIHIQPTFVKGHYALYYMISRFVMESTMDRNQYSKQGPASHAHREAETIGTVICRLDAVLVMARRSHQLEDLAELARLTGIDHRVLADLERDRRAKFDASVLARLCATLWGITPGTLLEYLPPPEPVGTQEGDDSSPKTVSLTLPVFSLRSALPGTYGRIRCLLRNRIAEQSEQGAHQEGTSPHHPSYVELGRRLGLHPETVSGWMNDRILRYDRTTLAQLCHRLQVGVDGLLLYVPPTEQAGAYADG
jgi:transcriptional regulator with XRE-family HTH domain